MAATLKIIPFFVPESSLRQIENLLAGAPAFGFHPLKTADVALIQTRIPGQTDRLFAATKQSLQTGLRCWDAILWPASL